MFAMITLACIRLVSALVRLRNAGADVRLDLSDTLTVRTYKQPGETFISSLLL